MKPIAMLSRRCVLGSLAASSVMTSPTMATEESSADMNLLTLGSQFDALAAQLDGIECSPDVSSVCEQLSRVEAEIIAAHATTIDGLRVKARAVCWALLGDFDSADQSTTDKRMAFSIVRDLIRAYDQTLERPGAISKLVADATGEAL